LLEINIFIPSKLKLFGGCMNEFAVEGTPSEDFQKVLARILSVRLRRKIKMCE